MRRPTNSSAYDRQPGKPVVLVVDDDAGIRDSLDSLFRSVDLRVELFGSPAELLDWPALNAPCCIVLDVRLPGASGLDFHQQLAAAGVDLPVIFMTGHGDIPMSVRAMKAGAVDFLAKPFRDQDMLDAVMNAIERDARRRSVQAAETNLKARHASLTAREREVMVYVTDGLMNKQVAGRMNLSEITVKIHRGNVMRKMNAKSLADLVRMAQALGLSGRPSV
ncbi:response regulator transcription factor [Hansschlegelia sp. KR7-227]|uniref:response regulator transcription factor n=1 Tax=Hansschlegelia sp. KR7-227 TaxID=3400914 RepID=UPI003BFED056